MSEPGKDYGVKVIKAWGAMQVGRVIYPPAAYREQLLKARMVETVPAPTTRLAEVVMPFRRAR